MRSGHERQAVAVVEHLRYVATEGVPRTPVITAPFGQSTLGGASRMHIPGRYAPTLAVVGVGPQQVAHGSLVRHLLHAVQLADVVQRIDGRGQTACTAPHDKSATVIDYIRLIIERGGLTVQTEDLVVHHGRQRQVVEQVRVHLPHVCVAVLAHALVVESVPVHTVKSVRLTRYSRAVIQGCGSYTCVICRLSWLPRKMNTLCG